jgi:hypothetical protein
MCNPCIRRVRHSTGDRPVVCSGHGPRPVASGYGNASYSAVTGNGDTNGNTGAFTLFVTPLSVSTPTGDSDDQIARPSLWVR